MARSIIINAKAEPELKEALVNTAKREGMTVSTLIVDTLLENQYIRKEYENILKKKIFQKK